VHLNRLFVGHTHEDIDRIFGIISRYLRGILNMKGGGLDVLTPQDLADAIMQAFASGAAMKTAHGNPLPAHTVTASGSFDCKSWLDSFLTPISGCVAPPSERTLRFCY
jgi:hypothetical protein